MVLVLRAVLVLLGAVVIALGLNVGLGGVATMGWQGGGGAFFTVTDPALFAVRDSHIRFVAGVWAGLGAALAVSAFALHAMRPVVLTIVGCVVIGASMRLTSGNFTPLIGPALLPSLAAELVLFPLVGLWVMLATRRH